MRRGQTIVALLIAVAIIAILAIAMYSLGGLGGKKESPRADKLGRSTPELVKLKAVDEDCRNNLSQIRLWIQTTEASGDDQKPASLEESHLGSSFYSCPIGHEPYVYDPQTGEVHCPHPGHEKY